jgi:regulator of replication initiation timing
MIDREKAQIASLISKGNMTQAELNKARAMIVTYQATIADMNKQIAELNTKNEQLSNENHYLAKTLDAERQTTAQLSDQNKGLAKKVEAESLLQIAKVDVEAIEKRHSGKEVAVKRVKAAQELKIQLRDGKQQSARSR